MDDRTPDVGLHAAAVDGGAATAEGSYVPDAAEKPAGVLVHLPLPAERRRELVRGWVEDIFATELSGYPLDAHVMYDLREEISAGDSLPVTRDEVLETLTEKVQAAYRLLLQNWIRDEAREHHANLPLGEKLIEQIAGQFAMLPEIIPSRGIFHVLLIPFMEALAVRIRMSTGLFAKITFEMDGISHIVECRKKSGMLPRIYTRMPGAAVSIAPRVTDVTSIFKSVIRSRVEEDGLLHELRDMERQGKGIVEVAVATDPEPAKFEGECEFEVVAGPEPEEGMELSARVYPSGLSMGLFEALQKAIRDLGDMDTPEEALIEICRRHSGLKACMQAYDAYLKNGRRLWVAERHNYTGAQTGRFREWNPDVD